MTLPHADNPGRMKRVAEYRYILHEKQWIKKAIDDYYT